MMNLGERSCGSCKHFEPSTEWRRGWCRNTLLFAPSQSHTVQSEELDCSRGAHDFWEPKVQPQLQNAGEQHVKLPTFQNPLNLFQPAFAGPAMGSSSATGGHMMFASSGGGGGYDDDGYDDDFYDEGAPEPDPEDRPQSNRTRRSAGRANATGGRSRSASYQPEERYWTDYLRIALPVIGIILMLGLLWIWASQLLGDDNDIGDATPEDQIGLVTTETPDPDAVNNVTTTTGTPDPAQTGTNTNAGQIPIPGQNTETGATTPAAEATEGPFIPPVADGGEDTPVEEEAPPAGIALDTQVEVTEDNVNVRASASADAEIVTVANAGDVADVIDGPEEADGYVWWNVVLSDGSSGWMVEDYLVPAG